MISGAQSSYSKPSSEGKSQSTRKTVKGYTIRGSVVHGNHIGRTLGFPTANIQPQSDHPAMIPNGVYLVSVSVLEKHYNGLCNIGFRPTIGGTQLVVEVNIFDFSEDIYGTDITITIIRVIRKEKKFASLGKLGYQITRDKEKAMKILSVLNKHKTG